MTPRAPFTPPGGWRHAMTASGIAVHLCDPEDHDVPAGGERRALCGIGPVFPVVPAHTDNVTEASPLCRRCKSALAHYAQPPAPAHGPDPLLHLLRAGGLAPHQAQIAAGICRGYLASEMNSAVARGEVVLNERATRRGFAGRDTSALRAGSLMLAWARDVVHARRVWPPQPEPDPPPDGVEDPGAGAPQETREEARESPWRGEAGA